MPETTTTFHDSLHGCTKCGAVVSGLYRQRHLDFHTHLEAQLEAPVNVEAPSEVTLSPWDEPRISDGPGGL